MDAEEHPDREVLKEYKEQNAVEMQFRFLKQPFLLGLIFLKDNDRLEAMSFVFQLALLVAVYLGYRVRRSLEAEAAPLVLSEQTPRSLTRADLREWVEKHLDTPATKNSLRQRMGWAETIMSEMKGPRGLARASLRGTTNVQIQALLALAAHNIRKLVKEGPHKHIPARVIGHMAHTALGGHKHTHSLPSTTGFGNRPLT